MKKNVFTSKMKLNEFTNASLAQAIGLSASRLSAKINNKHGATFNQIEISKLKDKLKLTDDETMAIFFNDVVS